MCKEIKDCLNHVFLLSVTTNRKTDPDTLILLHTLKSHFSARWWRAFECLLALFLTVSVRTLLGNAQGCSSSTLSRLLNLAPWKDQELRISPNTWQNIRLRRFHQHRWGRKPTVWVRLDVLDKAAPIGPVRSTRVTTVTSRLTTVNTFVFIQPQSFQACPAINASWSGCRAL